MCNTENDEEINPDQLQGEKAEEANGFVLWDQFSRANLLPVNHPLLSPFPLLHLSLALSLMDLLWLAQCRNSAMHAALAHGCSLPLFSIYLAFPLYSRNIH